jgi:hypothetical protein
MGEVQKGPETVEQVPDAKEVTGLVESIDRHLDRPLSYGMEAFDRYMYEKWRAKSVEDRNVIIKKDERGNPIGLEIRGDSTMPTPGEYLNTQESARYDYEDKGHQVRTFYSKRTPQQLIDIQRDLEWTLPAFRKMLKEYTLKPVANKEWDQWGREEKAAYVLKLKRIDLMLETGLRQDYHSMGEVLEDVKKVGPNLLDVLGDEFFDELDQKYHIKINKTGFKLGIMALEFALNGVN